MEKEEKTENFPPKNKSGLMKLFSKVSLHRSVHVAVAAGLVAPHLSVHEQRHADDIPCRDHPSKFRPVTFNCVTNPPARNQIPSAIMIMDKSPPSPRTVHFAILFLSYVLLRVVPLQAHDQTKFLVYKRAGDRSCMKRLRRKMVMNPIFHGEMPK